MNGCKIKGMNVWERWIIELHDDYVSVVPQVSLTPR